MTTFLPVLAPAQLELGYVDLATQTVEQALTRARPRDMRLAVVDALRIRAMVVLRREHWAEAARCLGEGITLARSMPYPYAEARLLDLQGQLPGPSGDLVVVLPAIGDRRITPRGVRLV